MISSSIRIYRLWMDDVRKVLVHMAEVAFEWLFVKEWPNATLEYYYVILFMSCNLNGSEVSHHSMKARAQNSESSLIRSAFHLVVRFSMGLCFERNILSFFFSICKRTRLFIHSFRFMASIQFVHSFIYQQLTTWIQHLFAVFCVSSSTIRIVLCVCARALVLTYAAMMMMMIFMRSTLIHWRRHCCWFVTHKLLYEQVRHDFRSNV